MKKTLSIILSLALLLGAVVVIPAFSVSADTVEFSDYAFNKTIFDSSIYNDDPFIEPNVINPNNQVNPVTGKKWLFDGATVSGSTTSSSNKDGLFMPHNKATPALLEYNAVERTDITNFEWQFDVRSGHTTSAQDTKLSFVFHVGENSNISSFESRAQVLAVTLFGSNYTTATKYQYPLSLMAEYSTTATAMRPLDYDAAGVPKDNSYIDMSAFANKSGDAYTTFKNITINIKLYYRELIVTVWQTGNEATKVSKTMKIPETLFNTYTSSGDFAVVSAKISDEKSFNGNMFITNMTIKSDLYDSGKASSVNYKWWETNTIYEKDASTGVWKTAERSAGYHVNSDAVQLNVNGVADRLLANNGYLPEGGVENFVWGFDYTPGRDYGGRTSFAFHVANSSNTTEGQVITDSDENIIGFNAAYHRRTNMLAVTLFSKVTPKSTQAEIADGIVIQHIDSDGNVIPVEVDESYITKGAIDYPEQTKKDLTSVNAHQATGAIFYSVRIVYYEGTVTVYMWKRGDTSTMFAVSAEIDESLVPTAGDFSIINANNFAYFDNMFISSLDSDATEAEKAVAHYENTYETITGKALCAHDYNGVIVDASTYFVEGSKKLECACGDILATGIKVPVAEDALIKDECKEEFANGNLTITLTYSEALIEDIQDGAVISFNYSIGNYSPENPIELDGTTGAVITLEGFNTDRLNAQLTYYLTAKYDGVDTTKLADDTTRKLTVANDVELDSKTSTFVNALNADGANTVVSTKIDATTHFAENTITADLKEGTMVLNFIASDALVAKLGENSGLARTNKITVTIDGVANKYEFTPDVMRKSTTINISGMSFEQLNGRVTIDVEFIYEAATEKNISDTIVFEGSAAVAATNTPVANAFAAYIAG